MRRGRHFQNLGRRVEIRAPKPKIVIYSEGEKTESDYFAAMKRTFRNSVVEIEFIGGAGCPITIANKAALIAKKSRIDSRGSSYTKNDEYWAVFDRDEHPRIEDALSICGAARVKVAFSNPCFEVWLILHFQDYHRPDHRHDVQRYLEALCPDYDRNRRKTTDCNKLMTLIEHAERRAEQQLSRRLEEGDPPGPPFTTVYELTRRIRNP